MGQSARKFEVVEGGLGCSITALTPIEQPIEQPLNNQEMWLSVVALAELAKVSPQAAQKALSARRWRGVELNVREVQIGRGGAGGMAPQVHVDSLPDDLRAAWYLARGVDVNAPAAPSTALVLAPQHALTVDPRHEARLIVARWRHGVIKPVLAVAKGKHGRGKLIEDLAGQTWALPDGSAVRLTRATIFRWVLAYEQGRAGLAGLMPKISARKGTRDVVVTRAWDGFFGRDLADAQMAEVADSLRHHIRSLWASGERGKYMISEKATTRLVEMSRALKLRAFDRLPLGRITGQSGTGSQCEVCFVNTRMVDAERDFAMLAVKDKDNARWQDDYMPHIRRDYSAYLPREIVVGDVHPVDVMMHRADGSEVYPKAISWFDIATNEVHMTFVLMERDEGVKREHVAMAFEAMVNDWGLPKLLYLDNGSEYKSASMIDEFTRLSKLAQGAFGLHDLGDNPDVAARVRKERDAVVRSLPYNAKGKPGIEGAFGNIEKVQFAVMPGWTSGDRMSKKTHAKGKAAKPFPGSAEDFLIAASTMLENYHKRSQKGKLRGRCPNEVLSDFIAGGWGKTVLGSPDVLRLAFSEEVVRTPRAGRVQYKNRHGETVYYYAPELILVHHPVTLRVPAWKPDVIFVFDGETRLCEAVRERAYGVLERAGAEELGRRRKYVLREIAQMRQHCALLDLVAETARHNSHLADSPTAPVGTVINAGALDRMQEADAALRKVMAGTAPPAPPKVEQFKAAPIAALKHLKYEDEVNG